jgi:hypothetical protein
MPVNAFQLITGGNKLAAILAGAGVLVWVLAYIFIFVKGFQDKSYGIPAVAITLNFTWEFIFLYIYPTNPPARFQDWLWLLFDLPNLYLLLRFGRNSARISFHLFPWHSFWPSSDMSCFTSGTTIPTVLMPLTSLTT